MAFNLWDKIEKLNREGLLPYVLPGYKADNRIFLAAVFIILIWLCAAAWPISLDTKTHVYVNCPNSSINSPQCENPFWRENYVKMGLNPDEHCPYVGLCDFEYLQPGQSWGSPPNFFYNNMTTFSFLIIVLAILINHFVHNKNYIIVEDDEKKNKEE